MRGNRGGVNSAVAGKSVEAKGQLCPAKSNHVRGESSGTEHREPEQNSNQLKQRIHYVKQGITVHEPNTNLQKHNANGGKQSLNNVEQATHNLALDTDDAKRRIIFLTQGANNAEPGFNCQNLCLSQTERDSVVPHLNVDDGGPSGDGKQSPVACRFDFRIRI